MNAQATINPATDHATERPGGVRGWFVLVLTLGIMVAVPLITVLAWQATKTDLGEPEPLVWSERAEWQLIHVQGTTLNRGPVSSARTGDTYFELPSPLTPEEEAAVWRCVQLAQQPADAFAAAETVDALRKIGEAHPELFYPKYLIAQATGAEALMAEAVMLAPRCLVVPVTDASGRPAVDQVIGDIELVVAKVVDDTVDESLVFRYPRMRTDALGRAYLPTFAGKYRFRSVDPAAGVKPTKIIEGYFTFPGQAGRLPAWVVVDDAAIGTP